MDREHEFIVYALCDSLSHEIRYVGASTRGLVRPLGYTNYQHNPELSAWLRNLLACRREYVVIVLSVASSETELFALEAAWIATGVKYGWPLTNKQGVKQKTGPEAPVLMNPGVRWAVQDWRKDPEVRARLQAARKSKNRKS